MEKTKQLSFYRNAPVVRVATVSRQGRPQVTPVCHVEFNGNRKFKVYESNAPSRTGMRAESGSIRHRKEVQLSSV